MANRSDDTVSVIDTATNTVVATIFDVGNAPHGVAVSPDGTRVYVVDWLDDTVSVIDTATNEVVDTIEGVGTRLEAVVVSADGTRVYVLNSGDDQPVSPSARCR